MRISIYNVFLERALIVSALPWQDVPLLSTKLHVLEKTLQAFVHEVIDIDSDEDVADSAIIEKELNKIKKGKAVVDVSDGHLNGHSKVRYQLL